LEARVAMEHQRVPLLPSLNARESKANKKMETSLQVRVDQIRMQSALIVKIWPNEERLSKNCGMNSRTKGHSIARNKPMLQSMVIKNVMPL